MSSTPGWTIHTCIADEDRSDAVVRLLGRENAETVPGCSHMRTRIDQGRLASRQSCTGMAAMGAGSGAATFDTKTRFSGTLTPTRIIVNMETRTQNGGQDVSEMTGRLIAERTGECSKPAIPVAGPPTRRSPAVGPAAIRDVAPPRQSDSKTIPAMDPSVTAPTPPARITSGPVAPSAAATPESPDDVVVVARRLRKLRLNYASTGRVMSRCRADISSGDKRVDRIGCAIVRACVREGFGEPEPALTCFRRKVDSLEPD